MRQNLQSALGKCTSVFLPLTAKLMHSCAEQTFKKHDILLV